MTTPTPISVDVTAIVRETMNHYGNAQSNGANLPWNLYGVMRFAEAAIMADRSSRPSASSTVAEGKGVRVKALEWMKIHDALDEAGSVIGLYRVWSHLSAPGPELVMPSGARLPFASLDEAKAAAQADYTARIIAALSHPEPGAPQDDEPGTEFLKHEDTADWNKQGAEYVDREPDYGAVAPQGKWHDIGYLMSIIDAAIEDGFDPDEDGPLLDEIRAEVEAGKHAIPHPSHGEAQPQRDGEAVAWLIEGPKERWLQYDDVVADCDDHLVTKTPLFAGATQPLRAPSPDRIAPDMDMLGAISAVEAARPVCASNAPYIIGRDSGFDLALIALRKFAAAQPNPDAPEGGKL